MTQIEAHDDLDARVDRAVAFAEDYCAAAGGARPGMCQPAAWNIHAEFGWPIVEGSRDGLPHHWNALPDGRIFDATAAMFGDGGPRVLDGTDERYSSRIPERTPSATDAQAWTDGFFSDERGEPYLTACESHRTAGGMCSEVSEAFADYLYSIGVPGARTLDLDARGHEYIPDGSPHTVVEVRGLVIDLTHRQFDEGADLPYARPREEFLREWAVVSWD